jgi:hypothetical protein
MVILLFFKIINKTCKMNNVMCKKTKIILVKIMFFAHFTITVNSASLPCLLAFFLYIGISWPKLPSPLSPATITSAVSPNMGVPRFTRPKTPATDSPSPYLYVANCGPAVGLSYDTIASVFNTFGQVKGIYAADESGTRVIVSYSEANSAQQALTALNGKSCADLGGRSLHIRYSVIQPNCEAESQQVNEHIPVSLLDSEVNIPGLYLVHDFLSPQEEKVSNVSAF